MTQGEPARRRAIAPAGLGHWKVWAAHLVFWFLLFGGIVLLDQLR